MQFPDDQNLVVLLWEAPYFFNDISRSFWKKYQINFLIRYKKNSIKSCLKYKKRRFFRKFSGGTLHLSETRNYDLKNCCKPVLLPTKAIFVIYSLPIGFIKTYLLLNSPQFWLIFAIEFPTRELRCSTVWLHKTFT